MATPYPHTINSIKPPHSRFPQHKSHATYHMYHIYHIQHMTNMCVAYLYSLDPPRPTLYISYNTLTYTYHTPISHTIFTMHIPYFMHYARHIPYIYITYTYSSHILYIPYIHHIPQTPHISHISYTTHIHTLHHTPICPTPDISTSNPTCIFSWLWLG